MPSKQELRALMLTKRKKQTQLLRHERSLKAQHNLIALPLFQKAKSLTLYLAMQDEVDTTLILNAAVRLHKTVYLPRVVNAKLGQMEFVPYVQDMLLNKSKFGILEPAPRYLGLTADGHAQNFAPDIIIIPGLAFTLQGIRLGYGGGFYDRFLTNQKTCPRIGLCFAFQIIDFLPQDSWVTKLLFKFTSVTFVNM